MPVDPIDPGAMPLSSVVLTASQVRQFPAAVEGHTGDVRVEKLSDAYVRVVLIGAEGDPVGDEKLLFPV
jgi:hypothetical protein